MAGAAQVPSEGGNAVQREELWRGGVSWALRVGGAWPPLIRVHAQVHQRKAVAGEPWNTPALTRSGMVRSGCIWGTAPFGWTDMTVQK